MKNDSSLRDKAYQNIRKKMLMGRLSAGSQISEPMLAKLLGIGRTPVREAIQQLQVEGLVERVPRRGTVVRVPKRMDIVDLYELREGLEGYAITLSSKRISAQDLTTLRGLCDQLRTIADRLEKTGNRALDRAGMQQFLAADMGYHLLLISATGNRHIMKVISDSHVMSQIFSSTRQEHTLEVVRSAYRFHNDILEAVARSDADQAGSLMVQHIRQSLREALEHYDLQKIRANTDGESLRNLPMPRELLDEIERVDRPLDEVSWEEE